MKVKCIGIKVVFSMVFLIVTTVLPAQADDYMIDPEHSFIEFRIQHLGYSWLHGRFNKIKGDFNYDTRKSEGSHFNVEIATSSIDTNHVERDKHLRSKDFLEVDKFPKATFKSTFFSGTILKGILTLHGMHKPISIAVKKIGEGKDPWGGYRVGFHGSVSIKKSDFGIMYNLGPAGETIEFELGIEGIKK